MRHITLTDKEAGIVISLLRDARDELGSDIEYIQGLVNDTYESEPELAQYYGDDIVSKRIYANRLDTLIELLT